MSEQDLARDLLANGVDPVVIARVLDIPLQTVNSLEVTHTTRFVELDDVAQETAAIIGLAIDEARQILIAGTPAMKLRLITSILGRAMAQLRSQSPRAILELRAQFEELVAEMANEEP